MGIVLRAHPVRGESHIQRNAIAEVATRSPPFYNEPHRSHVLFVKSASGTTFTSWSQHHFVAIGKPACAQSFALCQQATVHLTRSLYYCLFARHIYGVVIRAHSVRGEPRNQRNASGEFPTVSILFVKVICSQFFKTCFLYNDGNYYSSRSSFRFCNLKTFTSNSCLQYQLFAPK